MWIGWLYPLSGPFYILPGLLLEQDSQIVGIPILRGLRHREVVYVHVEYHRSQDRSLGDAILEPPLSTALTVTGVERETAVIQHLHDEFDHMAVWDHL